MPICGIVIGWVTNLLAIEAIFEPVEPKRILGIKFHGLLIRRQLEVAETYSAIIADEVITIGNLGDDLLNGPKSDRTHRTIARHRDDTAVPGTDPRPGVQQAPERQHRELHRGRDAQARAG